MTIIQGIINGKNFFFCAVKIAKIAVLILREISDNPPGISLVLSEALS